MTQHSSLKIDSVGRRHRNVLKRHERLRALLNSDENKEGGLKSVYRLPKMKLIKLKVKKEKATKEEAAGVDGAIVPQAGAAAKPIASTQKPQAAEKSKGK